MLRIGKTPFRNTEFLYFGLDTANKFYFRTAYPPELGSMLLNNEVDIAPASSIIYAMHPKDLLILPNFSISARGKTNSILLFSDKFSNLSEIKSSNDFKVALPYTSATSIVLIKIISKIRRIKMKFIHSNTVEIDKMLKFSDAALLIGDDALRNSISRNVMLDLGLEWLNLTGEGMVYALWLVNKNSLKEKEDEIKKFAFELEKAKEYAYKNFDYVAEKLAHNSGIDSKVLKEHLSCLSYNLCENEIEWLRTYFRYAEKFNLIDKIPEPNFVK